MIELRTLGGLHLSGPPHGDYRAVLAQPKRLALLAYLAVSHQGRFASRDTIVGLFWPELDADHARSALRQSLSFLRRALGEKILLSGGSDGIAVNDAALLCDAVAFDRAYLAGDLGAALELYRGELLEGLYVSDAAPELEHWIDHERARLREFARQAARKLTARCEAEGNIELAVEHARRGLAFSPQDEGGLRRLMTLLERLGDYDGAIRVYQTFGERLAADYGVRPSAETTALVARLRAGVAGSPARAAAAGSSEQRDSASPDARVVIADQMRTERIADAGAPDSTSPRLSDTSPVAAVAPATPQIGFPHRVRRAARPLAAAAALTVVAIAGLTWRHRSAAALQSNVVAVAPWRVSGADSSLLYLREGMVDLLGAALTGEGGPRAVDPRTALSAWHRASPSGESYLDQAGALRIARRLGADQLLLGEVVGSPARLVLNATLLSVASGNVLVRTTAGGPVDSLTSVVDDLTASLLLLKSNEGPHRLAAATSASLPALRAYLDGRGAYRRGRYREAVKHFSLALDRDSSFALAGWGIAAAAGWFGVGLGVLASDEHRGIKTALAWQHRLSARDRALVRAEAGRRYPEPAWVADCLDEWGRAVTLAPDQPEAWFWLGDCFYHSGAFFAIDDARVRAANAFRRSLELDSTVAGPLAHLVEMAARDGNHTAAKQLGALYLARDSTADAADYVRWRVALALDDTATLGALRRRFDRVSLASLLRILNAMQYDGVGLDDADGVASALRQRLLSADDRASIALALWDLALTRGRPQEAVAAGGIWRAARGSQGDHPGRTIGDALFADGDTSAAMRARWELGALSDGEAEKAAPASGLQQSALCTRALWDIHHGNTARVQAAIRRLETVTVSYDTGGVQVKSAMCAATLEALLTAATEANSAGSALHRLDSLAAAGAISFPVTWVGAENLIVARLLEARGDVRGALAAVRRRTYLWSPRFLATSLREEGRLAAITGDRAGAIRAYRHYLALRSNPEPRLQADAARIRGRLTALERERP